MKYIFLALSFIYLLFAYWQLNDIDAHLWVTMYLLVAAIPILAIFKVRISFLNFVVMTLCVVGAIIYIPGLFALVSEHQVAEMVEEMQVQKGYIEESRESLGLLIALLTTYWVHRKTQ